MADDESAPRGLNVSLIVLILLRNKSFPTASWRRNGARCRAVATPPTAKPEFLSLCPPKPAWPGVGRVGRCCSSRSFRRFDSDESMVSVRDLHESRPGRSIAGLLPLPCSRATERPGGPPPPAERRAQPRCCSGASRCTTEAEARAPRTAVGGRVGGFSGVLKSTGRPGRRGSRRPSAGDAGRCRRAPLLVSGLGGRGPTRMLSLRPWAHGVWHGGKKRRGVRCWVTAAFRAAVPLSAAVRGIRPGSPPRQRLCRRTQLVLKVACQVTQAPCHLVILQLQAALRDLVHVTRQSRWKPWLNDSRGAD